MNDFNKALLVPISIVLCELNQAKLGSVKFRQSCQLNFGIVVRGIKTTNFISRTLFVEKI